MISVISCRCASYLILILFQFLIISVTANERERFTHDYLDTNKIILRLGCHDNCSRDRHLASIFIYNVKTLEKMAVLNSAKPPIAFISAQEEMSYYVAGSLEKDSCHLELLITNVKPLTHLEVACNLTRVDETGTVIIKSLQLSIATKEPTTSSYKTYDQVMYSLIVAVSVLALLLVAALGGTIRKRLSTKRGEPTETSHIYNYPTAAELRDEDGDTGHLSLTRSMTSQHPGYLDPISVIYSPSGTTDTLLQKSHETHYENTISTRDNTQA